VRFLQLLRALIAAHLNGLPAELHLDGIFIQLAIASRTGFLSHVITLSLQPNPGFVVGHTTGERRCQNL
jgi:hypothetical protein